MSDTILDAVTSDPAAMGWMDGLPPAPDKRILAARADHMRFPMTRYAFSHMREFVPTARVGRRTGTITELPRALRDDLDAVTFAPLGGDAQMTWSESLAANFTDGILVLHRGTVVYERWFGVTTPQTRHIAFSVTKSFFGTIAAMLIAEGKLDPGAPVLEYLPEVAGSGFADATVRHVLDMTTALDYSEDYTDPNSGIGAFSNALGLTPRPPQYAGPTDMYGFIPAVKKLGTHGEAFTYRTVNTEVLGWIIARIEGKRCHEVLSARLWQPLGMEGDADIVVDSAGMPFTGGGLCPVLADFARMGEAMRLGGLVDGRQIIPAAVIADIRGGGDPAHFAKADFPLLRGWSYRGQWWVSHNAHGTFSGRGIHGQTIHVDPAAEMTIARFASHPVAANGGNDPASLPAYQALAEHLVRTT